MVHGGVPAQSWSSLISTVSLGRLCLMGKKRRPRRIGSLLIFVTALHVALVSLFLDAIRLCWIERDGPRLFLLAWIVPGWLMFELLPEKQWHHGCFLLLLDLLLLPRLLVGEADTSAATCCWAVGCCGVAMPVGVWLIWANAMLADQLDPSRPGRPCGPCDAWPLVFPARIGDSLCCLGESDGCGVRPPAWWRPAQLHPLLPAHQGVWLTDAVVSALESSSGRSPLHRTGPYWGRLVMKSLFCHPCPGGDRLELGSGSKTSDRWLIDDGSLGALPEILCWSVNFADTALRGSG